jgi:hypothetical protein
MTKREINDDQTKINKIPGSMDGKQVGDRIIEIPGKHGLIRLVVPDNKPTKEELDHLYQVIAQTIVNTHRRKQQMEKEKENYDKKRDG